MRIRIVTEGALALAASAPSTASRSPTPVSRGRIGRSSPPR